MSNVQDHADKVIQEAIRRMEKQGHKIGPHNGDERLSFHLYRQCVNCNSSVYAWTQNGMYKCGATK